MQVSSLPISITLKHDKTRPLTLNQNNSRYNQSTIVVFRDTFKASHFRNILLNNGICVTNNTWTLYYDTNDEKKVKFTSELTNVEYVNKNVFNLTPFNFYNNELVDKLITYNISVMFLHNFMFQNNTIEMFGDIWTPPEDVMYYPSDIKSLYNKIK